MMLREIGGGVYNKYCGLIKSKLIASLTSWPKRIETSHLSIKTILNQTVQPDLTVLWLAKSEFPNKESDLPKELTSLLSRKFEIRWTEDIKSYKKLIPSLEAFPDDVVITFDDDLFFDRRIIERLINGYLKYPNFIQCHRTTTIIFNDINDIRIADYKYPQWTYLHKLSGGAGCLYPPHCFYKDILRKDLFMQLAPTSDDIWFWLMAAMNGFKVNIVEGNLPDLHYIPNTQEVALCLNNDSGEKLFFVHLRNILNSYPVLIDLLKNEQKLQNLI